MVDLIEKIGPYLGIAAFLGLSVLAFLIFQQAREVRRLREWAGRAPERAEEAAEAMAAASEARGEATAPEAEADAAREEPEEIEGGRVGAWWTRLRERFAHLYGEADRRSPFDPRYFLVVAAVGVIAAAVLTGGFGLFEDEGGAGGKSAGGKKQGKKVEVAVLNATQETGVGGVEIPGVQGLASAVSDQVVKPAGFKIGSKEDAPEGEDKTMVVFEPDHEDEADELADAVMDQLGGVQVSEMTDDVRSVAGGASVALLVGRDNANFGGSGDSG